MSRRHRDPKPGAAVPRPLRRLLRSAGAALRGLFPPHRERGQAIIEFALLLPIILMFILVIMDFGTALDRREVIQHAVREGTRAGAVGKDAATIKDRTVDQSQGVLDTPDITVCYVDGDDSNTTPGNAGDSVRVSATYVHNFSIGGQLTRPFGFEIPAITMTPQAEARLETSVSGATACS